MKSMTKPMPSVYSDQRGFLGFMAGVKEIVGRNIGRLVKGTPGMTQRRLSVALNINAAAVTRWIAGDHLPEAKYLDAMAVIFGVPVGELFSESGATKSEMSHDDAIRMVAAMAGYTIKKIKK